MTFISFWSCDLSQSINQHTSVIPNCQLAGLVKILIFIKLYKPFAILSFCFDFKNSPEKTLETVAFYCNVQVVSTLKINKISSNET